METIKIDTKGQDCPIPLIELKKAVAKAEVKDVIELEFTCPEATTNLPRYAAENDYEVLKFDKIDKGSWTISVEKSK